MSLSTDLMKAIRSGNLRKVVAALDAGAPVELDDGKGDPGLPLAIACFMGHAEIVRELALRGAKVNLPDNNAPISPLAMAVRGERKEVVKVLVEMGAQVPDGMKTGLDAHELMLARWRAQHIAASGNGADDSLPEVEEIEMVGGCYGTNTEVLEADVIRAAREMARKLAEKKNQS